jgi:uncharacterized protein (DUF302 family)/glutaredoxin
MMQLFQREGCPFSHNVRAALEARNLEYEAIPVAKLGSERAALLALTGDSAAVPVLVDGDRVIGDSKAILAYLDEAHPAPWFGDPTYGLTRRIHGAAWSDVVPAVTAALGTQGFGVLTEINVKATLKKKIDVDFRNYVILGACNPPIAHKALSTEPGIGLLLPCNVVVTEDDDGTVVVSAVDPRAMFKVLNRPDIEPLAAEVGDKLRKALAAIAL